MILPRVLGVCLLVAAASTARPAQDLLPLPDRAAFAAGSLALDPTFTLARVGASDPRIDAALERTRARLATRTGMRLSAGAKGTGSTLVVEVLGAGQAVQAVGEDESYSLVVTPKNARLRAQTPLGALWGLETFLQLVRKEGNAFVVPAVTIEDHPRFPWRGLLIDPSRRFQGPDVIRRILDCMASVKLNVLHWHLSDDQGFRVESRTFPSLHEKGADGHFYTQDEIRQTLAYARDRGIRVVPEFDMPGHATSWLVGHPELGSRRGPFALERTWGIFDDVLDPSREEVYGFLDRFLGEMAQLFPDAYLHIGGDEVTPREWNSAAHVLDFMYRNDLVGAEELQAHFNERIGAILTRHGKKVIGWDEVLSPALPKNIVVQSWRGPEALAKAASLGYDGILSNGYYLDHMQTAEFHYQVDPIPPGSTLAPEAARHILGGEACMWGEFVSSENIDSRLWPRAAAVAERLWSAASVRDVDDMYRRLEVESERLEAAGSTHRRNYEGMLSRLTQGKPTDSLRLLADLVEPVKLYRRGEMRVYTSDTPLERLVDTVRPESSAARTFRAEVQAFLAAGGKGEALDATLRRWRDNHAVLDPILEASPLAAEARNLSREVSLLGGLALDAVDAVRSRRAPAEAWIRGATRTLERASKPQAEVEIAVLPSVRKLVLAAQHIDALQALRGDRWNAWLDEKAKPVPDGR